MKVLLIEEFLWEKGDPGAAGNHLRGKEKWLPTAPEKPPYQIEVYHKKW